jgi:hypothetical protein
VGQAAAPREENLAALARFSDRRAVRDVLEEGGRAGYQGLLTLAEGNIIAAAREMLARSRACSPGGCGTDTSAGGKTAFQILPIIPNVPGYVREATEYGMAGAGLRRLARVGILGFVRAGLVAATHPAKVLRKDFATLVSILYELEMAELRRFAPPAVFLHPQMTDIALSFGNREFFERFARLMRRRYRTEPGLVTSNFVRLAEKIEEWRVPISLIVAPFNRRDYLMPGGLDAYRRVLASGRFSLVADRLSTECPTPAEAVEWALAQTGVCSAVVERTSFGGGETGVPSASPHSDSRNR